MYPDNSGKFTVSSHVRRLTIYSFVYNYSLSNPLVSYQLNGFDKKSITVNRSELVPIDYTNLPGGTYYFTVKLMDAMGRGNRSFAIQITKEKAFYEYPWFYAVMGLLVLACVVAGVRMYVARRMHLLELKHQAEAERERLVTELKMATQIQESMLPNTFPAYPDRKEFDIYASMEPAREVGGDFYDFYLIDDDHLGIVIADVSGKGVPASLFMMRAKTIVQSYAMLGITAGEILSRTNESLCNSNDMEMFVTAWIGVLEISTGIITAANAGHEYPMIYRSADDTYTMLKDKHGFVMGGLEGMFYKEYKIELHPGDKLFLYTDGVPEATDSNNELFGANRMLEALNAKTRVMPKEVLGNVRESVTVFVGSAEQFDDLTMLCLEYRGPSTSAEG
jgi:serine phosphatase RsbU (regulator of sigma subunit)